MLLELNQGPTNGQIAESGDATEVAVVLSWSRPAIARVCPSLNSTTVRASLGDPRNGLR